jgi:hypothetical protein
MFPCFEPIQYHIAQIEILATLAVLVVSELVWCRCRRCHQPPWQKLVDGPRRHQNEHTPSDLHSDRVHHHHHHHYHYHYRLYHLLVVPTKKLVYRFGWVGWNGLDPRKRPRPIVVGLLPTTIVGALLYEGVNHSTNFATSDEIPCHPFWKRHLVQILPSIPRP